MALARRVASPADEQAGRGRDRRDVAVGVGPAMAFKDGALFMPFGTPGGDVQPQAMQQVFLNVTGEGSARSRSRSRPLRRVLDVEDLGIELPVEGDDLVPGDGVASQLGRPARLEVREVAHGLSEYRGSRCRGGRGGRADGFLADGQGHAGGQEGQHGGRGDGRGNSFSHREAPEDVGGQGGGGRIVEP